MKLFSDIGEFLRTLNFVDIVFFFAVEECEQVVYPLVGSYAEEEFPDFLLEQYDEHDGADAHHLVEDSAQQSHAGHLGHDDPQHYEDENADEDVERTGRLHQFIHVVDDERYGQYVEKVFDSEGEKHGLGVNEVCGLWMGTALQSGSW